MLAIIDGDVLAYNACESRFKKDSEGRWLIDNNYFKKDQEEFTPEEDAEYLAKSWDNFKRLVQEVCDNVYADEYLMAVKGPDNFRNHMYPEYKMNRHKDIKTANHFVPIIREMAVIHEMAISSDGREADDMLRIWAEQCKANDIDYIICSIDKDLKCIPGKHYFIHKDEITDISEIDALRFYYTQLLKGDPTDNIPGIPKVGEVKAQKALALCESEEEFQFKVVDMYMAAYGDNWYDYLLSNGKMIYLQKAPNDYFKISDWKIVQEVLG